MRDDTKVTLKRNPKTDGSFEMLGMLGEEVASHAACQITQLPTTQNVQCMAHAKLGWPLYAL